MPTHEFSSLPDGAVLHAVDGGARYLRVDWVMRQELGGEPVYYCATGDWSTTPAGRLAAKDAEIAALQAHIAELETQLAATVVSPVPPTIASAATGMPIAHGLACPECGQNSFKNAHALRVHRGRAHSARPPATAPQPTNTAIVLLDDNAAWRCEECNSDAHARSLTQPGLCFRCAAKLNCDGVSDV